MPYIMGMMKPFEGMLMKVIVTQKQMKEATLISSQRNVPRGDAIHAIVARDGGFVLITRDNRFKILRDISNYFKPEEIT